ncbi:Brinker DNA-binding domain-containing protein [Caenorhabditis elegans]|uniref:Brinker DNA-binding domain-containing protein n=1 Tax=Caenorhabditis elegans TaxID=6239 RepID=F3Y5Q0_CAEEL|nr:Brinker DNA-binding domain-containing protein [Caenorhabditis elegans]CCA65657.1 Brinker DNA-binding domain-containing protein [Caenorhabditis elegans]|eukprot:NP_001256954.1 Uncharacterized protein CELE_Y44A6D.3 [Caenorhabditis elegans]
MSSDVRKALDPGTPYSRTLKQYSIDEKLAIISHAKNHGNRAAGREFNVAESSIREWRKNENKLIHNRDAAAARLNAQSSHSSGPARLNNMNNNNNNNHNHSKNNNIQYTQTVFPRRTPDDIVKHIQIAQITQLAMMKMDFTSLARIAPFLQAHQHQQQAQAKPDSISTASSVVGTPSSISSSSSTPPPSTSPVPTSSGSGRRKPRCPMKIVVAESNNPVNIEEIQENIDE